MMRGSAAFAPFAGAVCGAGLTLAQLFFKRSPAFPGWVARDQSLDAYILVEVLPTDAVAAADQSPMISFH